MNKKKDEELRARLLSRRTALEYLIARLRGKPDPFDPDAPEADEESEMLDSVGNEAAGELMLIKIALDRLQAGEYGLCQRCGDRIDKARLAEYPYALLCADCKQEGSRSPAEPEGDTRK